MPTLPWTPARTIDAGADAFVLGSRLELRSYVDIPGFLQSAMRIRSQVHDSRGAIGVSLIAQLTRKTFWTLSAWNDKESMDTFVGELPHRDIMGRYHDKLTEAQFTTWTVQVADLPKPRSNAKDLWRDAKARLAADEQDGAH